MKLRKSSGKVLDLRMDEGSGAVAGDSSRYGNDGALDGCKWVENGLEFNGSSDYVDCGNGSSLDITDAITFSAWIRPESISSYDGIFKRGGYDVAFWIATNTNGNVLFYLSGVKNWVVPGNSILYDGNWHFVAFTYDKNGGSNNMVFYRDMYVQSTTETGSFNSPAGLDVIIGQPYFFKGFIDDARIYNRALSAREIRKQYDATKHKYL